MVKKIMMTLWSLAMMVSVHGQIISRNEADDLLKSLNVNGTEPKRLDALLNLAEFNILKPGEEKADLDSASAFMKEADKLNMKLRSPEANGFLQLLTAYLIKERGQDSKAAFASAVAVLINTKDKFHLAMAELELSKFYSSNRAAESAEKQRLMEKASWLIQNYGTLNQKAFGLNELKHDYSFGYFHDLAWKIKFVNNISPIISQLSHLQADFWVQKEIADVHIQQGNLGTAKSELMQLVTSYKETNSSGICKVYDLLTDIYYNLGDYKQALDYAYLSINNVKTAEDSTVIASFYYRISGIYELLDRDDLAREWLEKSINYYISIGQLQFIYIILPDIVNCFIREKKTGDALKYIADKQRKFPPKTLEENKNLSFAFAKTYGALKLEKLSGTYHQQMEHYSQLQIARGELQNDFTVDQEMGWYYLMRSKFPKARFYLDKAYNELPDVPEANKKLFKFYYKFKLDSASGSYISAIQQLRGFQKFKDSNFTALKSRQIEELNISYETEQKKGDIKLLQNKAIVQQIEIQHGKTVRNWIITAALILLFLFSINYYQYRLKQKSNKLLEAQKEEIGVINKSLNLLVTEKDEILVHKEHLISEKEWLLKEVHHRVKNNLHTVICLLESQAVYLENDALKAIESSQHRIYAMSLIHQKLYQSDEIKTIDMSVYLPEFIQYLNDSFGVQRQVHFHLEIEPLQLGVSQAIPLALIVNEAVTNSIKYAFKQGVKGVISVSMYQQGEDIKLIVGDNGVGIDPALADMPSQSLGLKLMNGLSEDINANIKFENDRGTKITITFNVDPLSKHHNLSGAFDDYRK